MCWLGQVGHFCEEFRWGAQNPSEIRTAQGLPLDSVVSGTSFRDLDVWKVAMDLVDRVYDLTEPFPRHELYGLTSQLRRSASSIPSNIAEGTRQRTGRAKAYYYTAANASEAELETHLELSRRRRYARDVDIRALEQLATRVSKMLFRLIDSTGD